MDTLLILKFKKRLEEHKMPNAKNYLKILQIIKLFLYLIFKTKPHKVAFVTGSCSTGQAAACDFGRFRK
ncbi:MAG: hypothetical protein COV69_00405 [Parcubacteria group bacterium CG11_big_fil_rev_8_21_14_0_20_39_14]|nr:MAG: hypothetical protein COV69_00405 [Parcubacteria group bacterium CG11_big_fil_rev_8_21_14_0_20_39_14]